MLSMKEQLQQVKQQMTTGGPESTTRTTSAHKIRGGKPAGKKESHPHGKAPPVVTPWQHAQNAKKVDAPEPVTRPAKPVANRQQRTNRKKLEKLVSFWPELFSLEDPRPMVVGIDEAIKADIDARQLPGKGSILFMLGRYASHYKYLQALVAGGPRYDLNGNPAGEVTPEEQKQAAERLAAMKMHTGDATAEK